MIPRGYSYDPGAYNPKPIQIVRLVCMTRERLIELERNPNIPFTDQEKASGWHRCYSAWDGMVVGPGTDEADACLCELS
jgi:hypothetical protein